MDPLTRGDYPLSMKALVKDRLPKFTTEQSEMLKGSFDFLGLNYYTTYYAKSDSAEYKVNISYDNDARLVSTGNHSSTSWPCCIYVVSSLHFR